MPSESRTQLQKVTQELQASEARFHNLVSNSPDGVLIVDPNGLVCFVNPATEALFARSASDLMGVDFGFPVVADETTELDIIRQDGESAVVEMHVVETNWEGERVLLASLRDITERKQAEEERKQLINSLHRSNEELQQFAQVISHDLQEPLRSVHGFCQLLQQSSLEQLDDRSQEYVQHAIDGAKRMQDQINGLLNYARVHTQAQPFELVDCAEVVEDAIANLTMAISESRAVVSQNELPTVSGDRTQLLQLFQNLIGNAIKFRGDRSPEIRITAERKGREWFFSVTDNGIGIDPQQADRVFVIFQRLHTRKEYPGTGMGLAICKKIVERHGGHIWIESQPEIGSVFSFSVPIAEA